MGKMVLIWLVAPGFLALLSYAFGISLSVILRRPLNIAIAMPLGFLLIVVFGSFLTMSAVTAPYAAACIGLIGIFGLIICTIRFRSYFRMDYLSGLSGLIIYFVYSLPVIASGRPSWAGWVQLDDTASFLAITDRIFNAGQTVPSTIVSTYDRLIQVLLGGNGLNYGSVTNTHFVYPIGTFIPFGVTSILTGIEKAWLFQPYLSFAAALAVMLFVQILRAHISNKIVLVAVSSISIMASTIYSYVMWGGIKEIVLIVALTLFSLTLFRALSSSSSKEFYLYSFIGVVSLYFIGGLTTLGFVIPILVLALLVKISSRSRVRFLAISTASGLLLIGFESYLRRGGSSLGKLFVPEIKDPGNLSGPLKLAQVMGIWPSKDFRLSPIYAVPTYFVIGIAFVFAIAGMVLTARKGMWLLSSLLAACTAVIGYSYFWGGIWLTGKAIAVASPFFLLAAGIGSYEIFAYIRKSRRSVFRDQKLHIAVLGLTVIIGSGVLISDGMTYRNVWLAPYSKLDELRTIGKLYAGQGPALMTEYSVFGARYFLRDLDAEAASELRVHLIPMSDGTQVPKGFSADIGLFHSSTINNYRLLVLRRSPVASRPPLNYVLVWSGNYFEVWKKAEGAQVIKSMLPLGNNYTPGEVPSCQTVSTFLANRTKRDKIYAVRRDKVYLINFADGDLPAGWTPTGTSEGAVNRTGPGGIARSFSVDDTRDYDLSFAGSYPGDLVLMIDGDVIYSGHSVIEGNPVLTNTLTRVHLSSGAHVLTLVYKSPILMPGSDVASTFGPIYLSTQFAGEAKAKQVSISKIPELCTQNLDWIALTN